MQEGAGECRRVQESAGAAQGEVEDRWAGDGEDAGPVFPRQDVDEGEYGEVGDCLTFKVIKFSSGQHQAGTTVYPHFMLEVSRESVLRFLRSQILPRRRQNIQAYP